MSATRKDLTSCTCTDDRFDWDSTKNVCNPKTCAAGQVIGRDGTCKSCPDNSTPSETDKIGNTSASCECGSLKIYDSE